MVAVALVVAAMSQVFYMIGALYSPADPAGVVGWFPDSQWQFLSRNVLVGLIITGLGLRYFYVSNQWQRNVESEARTRIHALQARIRPHFLFNSMNTIAELTRTNPAAAEAAVENLSDLFRASLADSRKTDSTRPGTRGDANLSGHGAAAARQPAARRLAARRHPGWRPDTQPDAAAAARECDLSWGRATVDAGRRGDYGALQGRHGVPFRPQSVAGRKGSRRRG